MTDPAQVRVLILVGIGFGWLFSLTLHEWSHSIVAFHGGDDGVVDRGYLSWNPLRYLHPFWSVVFPMLFLFLGGIGLPGAAVYIDRSAIRSRAWMTAMSLAGPLSNLLFGVALGVAYGFLGPGGDPMHPSVAAVVIGVLVYLQFMACLFNLLPIPPLDGWNALRPWLPEQTNELGDRFGSIGLLLILFLFFDESIGRSVAQFIWVVGPKFLGIPIEVLNEGFRAVAIFST